MPNIWVVVNYDTVWMVLSSETLDLLWLAEKTAMSIAAANRWVSDN